MDEIEFAGRTFKLNDPDDHLSLINGKIQWSNVTRSSLCYLSTDYEEPLENFLHSFWFKVSEIKNYGETNRYLFTLYKIWKQNGHVLSIYIAETHNSEDIYRLVFFQRVAGKNKFVERSDPLKINEKYRIEILKYGDIFTFIIYNSENEKVSGGTFLKGDNERYVKLILCQGHNLIEDPNDSSSGYLEDFTSKVSEKPKYDEERVKEYDYNVFIAYYQKSGEGFAEHLYEGLKDVGVDAFFDKISIPPDIEKYSDKWAEYRNNALKKSNYFILLMTPGYETRPEVQKEIMMSEKYHEGKKILCKWHKLTQKRLKVDITDDDGKIKTIDFNEINYISYTNKLDLFREVYVVLENNNIIPSKYDD